jgi:hypothetical protein
MNGQHMAREMPPQDLPWRPERWRDTETGEVFTARWVTHKDINPDANEFDAELFDVGIPYQLDDLITGKMYRRKNVAIIRRGGLRYLLAAADIARAEGEIPAAYFATMTAKKNWPGTKATIVRTGGHLKYAELPPGDDDHEPAASPYQRQSLTTLAAEWIIAALAANGPMPSSDFSAKAKAEGIYGSYGTFSGGRKLAGVQSGKIGRSWWVWLPGQDRPAGHKEDIQLYRRDPAVLAAGGWEVPTPFKCQTESKCQGIEGPSIGVGIPGTVPPRPDSRPDMREHYRRFTRSCVLASDQADLNAVPPWKRLHRNQKSRHVSPPELDELLDDFDPAAEDPGDCVLWTGTRDKDGYAIFKAGGRQYRAGRWLWMSRHGPIGPGLEMAHHPACPHRHCVSHVTPQTKAKNLADRQKPVPAVQRESERRQRRDEIRAARFREEKREYWSTPQAQRYAEYRAAVARESVCR